MRKFSNLFILGIMAVMCSACQNNQIKTPQIVPAVEVKQPETPKHSLGIIGATEPIYILPMKSPFYARIDTGAENSALDVSNLRTFERDGEKWVAFTMTNRETGEKHRFEKEVERHTTIKRINEHEKRVVVEMDVKFGSEIIKEKFSLADRSKFEYQVLVGRNILTGRAIVDTSLENTLH